MKGAGEPQVAIRPLSGITPEQARDIRARAWAYAFECFNCRNGKEAARPGGPDDVRKDLDAHTAKKYTG